MKRRDKYTQGAPVPITAYMRWVRRRTEWAARQVMVTKPAIRAVGWEWVKGLRCKPRDEDGFALFGRVKVGSSGRAIVVINCGGGDDHWEDTALHELSHALLYPVEGLRSRGPQDEDELCHTPTWAALYGAMYSASMDFPRSGPRNG